MHPARASMRRGIIDTLFSLIILTGFSRVHAVRALPQQLGDLNNDGEVNVLDLVIDGPIVAIDGPHAFNSLLLTNGAVLTDNAESAQFDSPGQRPGIASEESHPGLNGGQDMTGKRRRS
jgi:hypothetical protein